MALQLPRHVETFECSQCGDRTPFAEGCKRCTLCSSCCTCKGRAS